MMKMLQFRWTTLSWLILFAIWPSSNAMGQSSATNVGNRTHGVATLPANMPVYRAGSRFVPGGATVPSGAGMGVPGVDRSATTSGSRIEQASATLNDMFASESVPDWSGMALPGMDGGFPFEGECDTCHATPCCCCRPTWSLGFDFTFLKPHFGSNPAFTTLESDGATFETFTESSFVYDRELAPRVWLQSMQTESLGVRAMYWQFDHAARSESVSPPANGFGRIIPPTFGTVDLSTSVPTSVFSTGSDINAYTVDLEGTKSFQRGDWAWLASMGLRYAEIDQGYSSNLRNGDGVTQGTVNFRNQVKGIGPTVSARAQRPFAPGVSLFGFARGSLLFGDGDTQLNAVEDQDLDTRLTTRQTSSRDDFLPITELQVGLHCSPPTSGHWRPFLNLALESQLWSDVGSASSATGDLGFFGFHVALGMNW